MTDLEICKRIAEIEKIAQYKGNSVKFRTKIFAETKKYLTTAKGAGLFTEEAHEVRKNLYFTREKEGHISLSNYMASVFLTNVDSDNIDTNKGDAGVQLVKNNLFTSSLNYESGDNSQPDLIKFDNTETASINIENLYSAYRELFSSNEKLPDKNGKPYTTRMLAQELAIYSFVGSGIISEAIEFHKFIPIEYLKDTKSLLETPAGTIQISALEYYQGYDTRVTSWTGVDLLGDFVTQFFQHNPKNATKYDSKVMNLGANSLTIPIKLDEYPTFIYKDSPGKGETLQEKVTLYQHTESGVYKKIDVLGSFGMSEYSYRSGKASSNITPKRKVLTLSNVKPKKVAITPPIKFEKKADTPDFNIENGESVSDVLKRISAGSFQYNANLSNLADTVLSLFKNQVLDSKIEIVNDKSLIYKGKYENKVITINMSEENVAETFLHEFIHSVTADYIDKYVDKNGIVSIDAPQDIKELAKVVESFKKSLKKTYKQGYKDFEEKYKLHIKNGNLPKERQVEVDFSELELKVFYASVNLKEFLSVTFSDNVMLLEEAKNLKYEKTSLNILEKLSIVWQRILTAIAGEDNNVAIELLSSTLSFLESVATEKTSIKEGGVTAEVQEETEKELDKYRKIAPNSIVIPNGYGGLFSLKETKIEEAPKNISKEDRDFNNSLPLCI